MEVQGSGRVCAFCGREVDKLYKEHCLPDWLGKRYGRGQTMRHLRTKTDKGGARDEWTGSPYQLQVRCTCWDCQHVWMAQLEEGVKPFLTPMIEGRGRTLYDLGREIVATWAVKTAMAFEGSEPTTIPTDHWRHIAASQTPPRNTQVWLGGVDDPTVTEAVAYRWHHGLGVEGQDAYAATISIGHLAIVVIGFGAEDPMTRKLDGWVSEALVEIWPAPGPIQWPPSLILDVPRLEAVGSIRFATGTG